MDDYTSALTRDGRLRPVEKPAPEFGSNDIVTEDSAAREFAVLHADALRYDHDAGSWFRWSGSHWQKETTGLAFEWARALARQLSEEGSPKARYVLQKTSFASGVERFARSDRAFAVTADHWNPDPFLLGTPGGTVDLRTGVIRPPSPRDAITKVTAVEPAPIADCPRWLQFLAEATGGDSDFIRFLQQLCGYALTGDTREHALVFIYGPGGNGKSVFLNTVLEILAAYGVVAAMDTFIASQTDKHPTDLAMLAGARLVAATETEEGRAWAESRIKQLTGGDPITAHFMRMDNFTFRPLFKLFIIGNHRPVLRNVDEAARRRFNIVPFVRTPTRPDRELEAKLRAEFPGILRWMIDGCLDWQRNGLVRPKIVTDATAGYFDDQDLFGQWLEDDCEVEAGNTYKTATSGELFSSWHSYATKAGEKPGSQKSFADNLQKRGIEKHKGTKGVRLFRGIRLMTMATQGERSAGE